MEGKHPIRQREGEISPSSSRPNSTVSRPLKSPNALLNHLSTPNVDVNSDGASLHQEPMERTHIDYNKLLRKEEE